MVTYGQLEKSIEAQKPRSAWAKGVKDYALWLLVDKNYKYNPSSKVPDIGKLEYILLNGADDWFQFSRNGGGLIYDVAIAKGLCSPSEFKKMWRKNGSFRQMPNPREDWCDVEGRALFQAFQLIKRTYLALKGN